MTAHAIMFHHFHDRRHPAGQGAISADEFDRLLDFVGVDRILPAKEWEKRAVTGTLRDEDIALSFDDALRCQYDVALPVLRQRNLTGFWFVYSSVFDGILRKMEVYRYFRTVAFGDVEDFYMSFNAALLTSRYAKKVRSALDDFRPATYLSEFPFYTDGDRRFRFLRDRILGPQAFEEVMDEMITRSNLDVAAFRDLLWMDNACLQELTGDGHVIGLHSYSHFTDFATLSVEQQRIEYLRNREHIESVTGVRPVSMSHPCNSYTEETFQVLSSLGIAIGFRSNMAKGLSGPYELPRQDHALLMRAMKQ